MKKILNLSVENYEPQDVLYQKSIDTDEAIAEYMIHTLYQFCKSMNIHADDLLFGGNVEENNYFISYFHSYIGQFSKVLCAGYNCRLWNGGFSVCCAGCR